MTHVLLRVSTCKRFSELVQLIILNVILTMMAITQMKSFLNY